MKIYSHRGNLSGKSPRENEPAFLKECIAHGFHVEIDLWFVDGAYWLGHDRPDHRVELAEFDRDEVIFHLKNAHVPRLERADAFAIDHDDYVLTLRGGLWMNYGQPVNPQGVMCSPELVGDDRSLVEFVREIQHRAAGICTDYPELVRDALASR